MKIRLSSFFVVFLNAALLFAFGFLRPASAQSSPNAPRAFALTNARIVTGVGADIERGTVIVRDGLIVAVGAGNLQVPVDVRVIDASGLTIYPGIVDASAVTGIPAPRPPQQPAGGGGGQNIAALLLQQQQAQQSQSNSTYPAGLQPEISAVDLIRTSEASIETARNSGFTTVLVVPRERIFQGQSALVNLSGETPAEAIVRAPVALHIQLVPLQTGQFPNSLMGSFAAVRQMFLDAQQLQEAQRNYERNPRGTRRPDSNKSLEALFPYLSRQPSAQAPVVFQANSEREIARVLNFAREFNLKAIIAGGTESARFVEQLKAQNIPVLLSLNFPRRTASASPEADPENLNVLRARVDAPKTAGRLAAAGVRFAFQSGGMANYSDFWSNAGKTVQAGLPKPAAIRAMTLSSAEIFGVSDRMGSIEPGKIANLTVVRGDIFDRSRAVTHVFVDGRMYEIPAGSPTSTAGGAASGAAAQAITGKWNLTMQLGGQTVQATLTLTPQRNQLTGQFESSLGNAPLSQGEITAEGFRFVVKLTVGEMVDAIFAGRVTGDQMSGTVTTPQGTSSFTGTKTP
jgi:hypothetical protein